mmetsp:Transcript_31354/g.75790  ORF Transcript_31354/g.75790 Transcript_31354/m.75790 type:complete len:116 (-) Transcript_31354:161-508(-)
MAYTRFFSLALTALALSLLASVVVSSPSQPQRQIAAEGTFVRGMMSADNQFALYMTVSETSRGGSVDDGDIAEEVGSGAMHPVGKARLAAVNFADVVRRRAFSPISPRQPLKNDQ